MVSSQEQVLRQSYRRSLGNKANALRDSLAIKDLTQLTALLHKLTGSAGMYGFVDLSQQARQLLNQIDETNSVDQIFESDEFIGKMTQLLDKMVVEEKDQ